MAGLLILFQFFRFYRGASYTTTPPYYRHSWGVATRMLYASPSRRRANASGAASARKGKASFVFKGSEELSKLVNSYLVEEATCNPLAYTNAIKNSDNDDDDDDH